jgi:K+-transporting ATPase KdpF subunit
MSMDWTQIVASGVAVILAGYLLVAMLKPEWFS